MNNGAEGFRRIHNLAPLLGHRYRNGVDVVQIALSQAEGFPHNAGCVSFDLSDFFLKRIAGLGFLEVFELRDFHIV